MSDKSDIGDKMAKMWLNVDIEVEVDNPDMPDIWDEGFILHILHLLVKDQILDFRVQPDKMDEEDNSVIEHIRNEKAKRLNPDEVDEYPISVITDKGVFKGKIDNEDILHIEDN